MVQQVRMWEVYTDSAGLNPQPRRVFGFGHHPDATDDDAHAVTAGRVLNNDMRIIMDELLVGNYLEEIACKDVVDTDVFDSVPIGATPDDIAKCALPTLEARKKSCTGPRAVCICKLDAGCGTGPEAAQKGEPVGVLDANQDGASDLHRFIEGSVGITCAGTSGDIVVPIDLDGSYWNPSGNQQVPATGGFDALGPAIVLKPKGVDITPGKPSLALPSNATCRLTFSDKVVDKQGIQVCEPPDGDITKDCTPGDLSAFTFKSEPLRLNQIQGLSDNDVDWDRTMDLIGVLSAPIVPGALTGITMTENGMPFTAFTVTFVDADQVRVKIHPTAAGGFAPTTLYTVTFTSSITDLYGQALPTPVTYHFTTGM